VEKRKRKKKNLEGGGSRGGEYLQFPLGRKKKGRVTLWEGEVEGGGPVHFFSRQKGRKKFNWSHEKSKERKREILR